MAEDMADDKADDPADNMADNMADNTGNDRDDDGPRGGRADGGAEPHRNGAAANGAGHSPGAGNGIGHIGQGANGEREHAPASDLMVEARRAIEAVLLVATDPTPDGLLAQLVELPADTVHALCMELSDEYDAQDRGFQLRRVAGGWRYQTNPSAHAYVERYALEGLPNRLSGAAMETLSIIAYKQPISRGQISAIRGVNVDAVLRTLVQRGYVDEHGRDDGPGQAALFGTTPFFLERLGLDSIDQLPPLGEFVPSAEVLEALEQTLKIEPSGQPPSAEHDPALTNGEAASTVEPRTDGSGIADGVSANGNGNEVADGASANGNGTADRASTNGNGTADGGSANGGGERQSGDGG